LSTKTCLAALLLPFSHSILVIQGRPARPTRRKDTVTCLACTAQHGAEREGREVVSEEEKVGRRGKEVDYYQLS